MFAASAVDRTTLIRAAALYLPIAAAVFAKMLRPSRKRLFAATLVAFAWTLPALLLVQVLNTYFAWWSFHVIGGTLHSHAVPEFVGFRPAHVSSIPAFIPQIFVSRVKSSTLS